MSDSYVTRQDTAEQYANQRYADLRSQGTIYVRPDQQPLVSTLRRYATRQGLKVAQSRPAKTPGLSPAQARQRLITVDLIHPDRPTEIYRPDAQVD